MKSYYHPASTTSRPLMLFAAENGLDIDFRVIDLFSGEQLQETYGEINPNRLVPVLEDGDFRLAESSAILKYIADKIARVNERMDWVNTQMCRDFAYGFVYPQISSMHKRPSEEVQAATIAWAKERAQSWLKILDQSLIGPKSAYLCGDQITIADYFGAPFAALGSAIHCDYTAYPNVKRWLGNMKELKSW